MVIQVILFLALVLIALLSEVKWSLLMFALVLPFHFIIKSAFDYFYTGGELFSAWKEVVVVIACVKVALSHRNEFSRPLAVLLGIFGTLVTVYLLLAAEPLAGLAAYRNYLFPILLFYVASAVKTDELFEHRFLNVMLIGGLISLVGCMAQHFFFNLALSTMKGTVDFVDSAGYIQYKTDSARILGMERMSGLFTGPNDLGFYCALMILTCLSAVVNRHYRSRSKLTKTLLWINLLAFIICLFLSFSRAAIALTVLAGIYIFWRAEIRGKTIKVAVVLGLFAIAIPVLAVIFPKGAEVIYRSVTLKEESAADRGNNFSKGFDKVITEFGGHGVGTADNRNVGKYEFFVESAFVNTAYEIGVAGLILLILLHFLIARMISGQHELMEDNPYSLAAVAIIYGCLLVSFFSINPFGMPFIYYWWMFAGLGLNPSRIAQPVFREDRPMLNLELQK